MTKNFDDYFYNCSKEYVDSISRNLYPTITHIINNLSRRDTQTLINQDLFWLLGNQDWNYDSIPKDTPITPPDDLRLNNLSKTDLIKKNTRDLCLSSTTLDAKWHSDFAKNFDGKLVQIEAQFGTIEAMFKDFFGFRVAYFERRLHLGIEIVNSKPNDYFSHRKNSVSGMAYFKIARETLSAIGLDCPIWLIGINY